MRALALAVLLIAPAAYADELGSLLEGGPLVRIETDPSGKFKEAMAIADVDAPFETVWATIKDFDHYKDFMPRVQKCDVTRDGNDYLLDMKIDTPLVSTRYTNRMTIDEATHTIAVKQDKGDLKGSRYRWRAVPLADGKKARIYYSGVIRNFSSLAESMDDDQQTITVGINVVSLMAVVKSVKVRAEAVAQGRVAAR